MKKIMTMKRKKAVAGVVFILPWLIGFAIFFMRPLIDSFRYSFQAYDATARAFVSLKSGLLQNYINLFTKDTRFLPYLSQTMQTMLYQSPLVICFSVVVGMILKSDFKGRTLMRGVFFLPVIVTTGIIFSIFKQSLLDVSRGGASESTSFFNPALIRQSLTGAGLSQSIVNVVCGVISNSADAVWLSGIQILIVLAGVMNIPHSYYEVASVEGGSAWVVFWKVTLPLLKPYLLVVAVYTIVDSFTSTTNVTMKYLVDTVYGNYQVAYGSAMFWIYFLIAFAVIGILFFLFGRRMYYEN